MNHIKMISTESTLPNDFYEFNKYNLIKDIIFIPINCHELDFGYFELDSDDNKFYFVDYTNHYKNKIENVEYWGKVEFNN